MRYLFLPDGQNLRDLSEIPESIKYLVLSALPTLDVEEDACHKADG